MINKLTANKLTTKTDKTMKGTLKGIAVATMLLSAGNSMLAQINVTVPEDEPIYIDKVGKVTNNGRILTEKGARSIFPKDIAGIRVTQDTLYITLKEEGMKKLDKEKGIYHPLDKKRKKARKR